MIHPGIEPIAHVSPRKPVDLNPRAAVTKTPHRAGEISEQHAQVWNAIVSTATGSNISGAKPDVPDVSQVDGYDPAFVASILEADAEHGTSWAGRILETDVSSVSEDAADAWGYMG